MSPLRRRMSPWRKKLRHERPLPLTGPLSAAQFSITIRYAIIFNIAHRKLGQMLAFLPTLSKRFVILLTLRQSPILIVPQKLSAGNNGVSGGSGCYKAQCACKGGSSTKRCPKSSKVCAPLLHSARPPVFGSEGTRAFATGHPHAVCSVGNLHPDKLLRRELASTGLPKHWHHISAPKTHFLVDA